MEDNDLKAIDYELTLLVRRATSAAIDKRLGNLERSHYLMLYELSRNGTMGVKALADAFHLDMSTASRQAAALEAKGYVERLPDPEDGRASFFQLTEYGEQELQNTKQTRLDRFNKLLKDWSTEDRQKFVELLSRLNRTFID
ncbi:MarR family transcriptional regulator [Paenibacillus sp. SYP-B3998]|uniref:MarR family transcriptional regulator n=1 Tax=Paenibacillus sp. SYP-B3998 TaxID=2678564 RepID=A0A6G4A155_9BACL|nr:MarR family transcriptional regulator [Paenibacillus sp. SYP-B3998]NEW08105.1 MarR family transcriptional regulator [Paenibacillus sp. SYP-B3998]